MGEKNWGRKYRNTVICIDSYDDGIPAGVILNPYLNQPKPFRGVIQLLKETDRMLSDMRMPQSFTQPRAFAAPLPTEASTVVRSETEQTSGKLATFSVSVLFRQNASWQGTVTWMDKNREESFRSVLELLLLMDSALCSIK